MKTANFNQKNTKYIPTRYFLSRHLGHLKPPRTFLTRHLFIDGHLLPSEQWRTTNCTENSALKNVTFSNEIGKVGVNTWNKIKCEHM